MTQHDRGLTLLPPPERLVPSLNSSTGEGGWAGGRSGGPSGQTQTGTQDGDLQSGTDNTEAMAELAALEAMAELGAQAAMAELGALEAMADGLRGLGLGPLGRPLQPEPFYPPKKFPWGS